MTKRTGGQILVDQLRINGCDRIFTVPGESFLGLLESLTDEGIRVVATRHEGGAAFMAEAYGQLTGRPAMAIGCSINRNSSNRCSMIVPARGMWKAFGPTGEVASTI